MAKGWTEFWLIWVAVDIVGVPLLVSAGYYASALLYVFYGAFTIFGFITWMRVQRVTRGRNPVEHRPHRRAELGVVERDLAQQLELEAGRVAVACGGVIGPRTRRAPPFGVQALLAQGRHDLLVDRRQVGEEHPRILAEPAPQLDERAESSSRASCRRRSSVDDSAIRDLPSLNRS